MTRAPFQVLVLPWRRATEHELEVAVFRRADYDLWQFISGGGEIDETPERAARREGREEGGISLAASYLRLDSLAMIPACWFRAWASWRADVVVIPEHAFAVEVGAVELQISEEHRELRWCSWRDAMTLLRFDSNRTALWELHERLFPGPHVKRLAYP